MEQNKNPHTDQTELETSLARLGIKELEERMEISPLLTDTGAGGIEDNAMENCCTCKIPNPLDPNGNLPYPRIDPGPTGPTNPNGFD
jgi:hypothetical protein